MPSTVATDPQPPALTWQLRLLGQPALVLASVAAGSQRCIVLRHKDAALLAVFRDSFLQRNASNRALLSAVDRRLIR